MQCKLVINSVLDKNICLWATDSLIIITPRNTLDADSDSSVSSNGYLCLAGASADVSGCVNAGDDEVSRLTSEDALDSLLHLLLLHFPLLLHLHRFLLFLAPFPFLALCPQSSANLLCLSPSPVLHSSLFHKRQESDWDSGRSQQKRLGQGLVADVRTVN